MRRTVALLLVSLLPASAAAQQKPIAFLPPVLDTEAINIGARRELFVDQTILGALSGSATRHLFYFEPATTQRSDVAMTWNADWEGSWTRYGTYIRDDDVIRGWYTACHTDGNHKNRGELYLTHRLEILVRVSTLADAVDHELMSRKEAEKRLGHRHRPTRVGAA